MSKISAEEEGWMPKRKVGWPKRKVGCCRGRYFLPHIFSKDMALKSTTQETINFPKKGFDLLVVKLVEKMYRGCRESDKTSNLRHHCARKNIMQERDQRCLMRIIKRDRRATDPQITADFKSGPSTSVTVRTIQQNVIEGPGIIRVT
ncbi:HTH_Tnp_Tc3_2 domain-containing protein [Trichonephila clavipes]|nr:HTH_Tnp_Tc3_2 domain-containing protein [Trichonephila clavipes]